MNTWQVLPYVNTPIVLVAFIVGAMKVAYSAFLRYRAKIVQSTPPEDRLEAISAITESFPVDVKNLPADQQAKIALAQIAKGSRRDLLIFGVGVAVLIAAIVAFTQQLANQH